MGANEAGNNHISWSVEERLESQPFRIHPTSVFARTEVRDVIVGLDVLIARASMYVCVLLRLVYHLVRTQTRFAHARS